MTDIVAFLTARLDEDERVALAVSEGPRKPEVWEAKPWPYGQAPRDWAVDCPFGAVVVDGSFKDAAMHIARHDPARVLRKVAAERAILAAHGTVEVPNIEDTGRINACTTCGETQDHWYATPWPCDTLKHLAAVYAEHLDYDPAWAVA